jgi:hypothetical protein
VARHLPRLRVVSVAFCGSALLYIGVAWLLVEQLGMPPLLELPFAVAVGIAVSQLLVILAGYLTARALRAAPAQRPGAGPPAPDDTEAALQRYTRSVVVASALREVAAVVGLLLTLFTGEILWVVLLAAAAVVSMLIHWPRHDAVVDFLQQQRVGR